MTSRNDLPVWLENALDALRAGNVAGYMEMYAPDAVHEFPFQVENGVRRLEGRDAIAAYMAELPKMIAFGSIDNIRVHETADVVVIEASGRHRRLADGAAFDLDYVWVIANRNGKVTHFRDHMNPLQLMKL